MNIHSIWLALVIATNVFTSIILGSGFGIKEVTHQLDTPECTQVKGILMCKAKVTVDCPEELGSEGMVCNLSDGRQIYVKQIVQSDIQED